MDWRTCEHKWISKDTGMNYRFMCSKCFIFSYIGPAYDLIEKAKSVFLTGRFLREGVEQRFLCR